jgi:hypothetical protein
MELEVYRCLQFLICWPSSCKASSRFFSSLPVKERRVLLVVARPFFNVIPLEYKELMNFH